jgi:large subunit ribosomal protein L6e
MWSLCCAGPYKVNGVPLRRVNQSYVIATSTKVNLEGLELPAIDDAYFAKEKAAKKSKEEQFFAQSSAVSCCFPFSDAVPAMM